MGTIIKFGVAVYVAMTLYLGYTLFVSSGQSLKPLRVNLLSEAAPEVVEVMKLEGFGWLTDARVVAVGGYHVAVPYSPSDVANKDFLVLDRGDLVFSRTGLGTQLYNPGAKTDLSRYIVNLQDWDNDGNLDSIYYVASDPKTGARTEVMDRNFDGVPEKKTVTDNQGMRFYTLASSQWDLVTPEKSGKSPVPPAAGGRDKE